VPCGAPTSAPEHVCSQLVPPIRYLVPQPTSTLSLKAAVKLSAVPPITPSTLPTTNDTGKPKSYLKLHPHQKATRPQSNLTLWQPPITIPISKLDHVLDVHCTTSELTTIQNICNMAPSATFVSNSSCPQDRVSIKELRSRVSHTSVINQQILNLYMAILKEQLIIPVLDSSFVTLLR
jgi:hypothetical protein